jgi:hypothetical protein
MSYKNSREFWENAGKEFVNRRWRNKYLDLKTVNEEIKNAKINLKLFKKCAELQDLQTKEIKKIHLCIIGLEHYIEAAEKYKEELKINK